MSHAEIAREMKLSPLTVKSHIARALKFIRTYLEEHHVTPIDIDRIMVLLTAPQKN